MTTTPVAASTTSRAGTRRPLVPVLVGAALLSACGPHVDLAVNLRNVSITVPKLAAPVTEIVAPSEPQPAALPPVPVTVTEVLAAPPAPVAAPSSVAPPVVVQAPVVACPKADQLAAPDVPASVLVRHIPAQETFAQTSAGSFTGSAGTPATGSLAGTVATQILPQPSTTSMVGQVLDNWAVLEQDATGGTQAETYQIAEASASPAATTPGLYLTGLAWKDAARGTLSFVPVGGGIRIIPIPVVVATSTTAPQFFTTATDPGTGTTMYLQGSVTGRQRVDVCGRIVDSYTADLTGTLTSPSAQYQIHWVKQVATQYGAQDVQNALTLTEPAGGFTWTRTLTRTTVPKDPA